MPARFLRGIVPQLCAVGVFLFLGGCSYLPPTIVPVDPNPAPERIDGVADIAPNADPQQIRVLFIHGIGEHGPCDPDTLLVHLTKALGVEQTHVEKLDPTVKCAHFLLPTPQPIAVRNAEHTAFLYTYDFSSKSGARRVKFAFLLWSPLTDTLKNTVLEPALPHHALLAEAAKTFERENLVDAILYGGRYRDVLRPAVEKALCLFVGGEPDPNDARICDNGEGAIPTAIITHSLGGYMLMDAMSDIYSRRKRSSQPDPHSAAEKVGRYLDQIFMLANQLKLLDLTTRTSEEKPPAVVANFRAIWMAALEGRSRGERGSRKRQLIAVSDPNDILSWQVTEAEFDQPEFTVANVYLGTAGEFFGLYRAPIIPIAASPSAAHVNYLQDDDVMDIIVCGMTGSTINRCAP